TGWMDAFGIDINGDRSLMLVNNGALEPFPGLATAEPTARTLRAQEDIEHGGPSEGPLPTIPSSIDQLADNNGIAPVELTTENAVAAQPNGIPSSVQGGNFLNVAPLESGGTPAGSGSDQGVGSGSTGSSSSSSGSSNSNSNGAGSVARPSAISNADSSSGQDVSVYVVPTEDGHSTKGQSASMGIGIGAAVLAAVVVSVVGVALRRKISANRQKFGSIDFSKPSADMPALTSQTIISSATAPSSRQLNTTNAVIPSKTDRSTSLPSREIHRESLDHGISDWAIDVDDDVTGRTSWSQDRKASAYSELSVAPMDVILPVWGTMGSRASTVSFSGTSIISPTSTMERPYKLPRVPSVESISTYSKNKKSSSITRK
ncbi:hypothetical protein BC829DRAFT_391434, partial [Chytridium lagenaria]